MAIPTFLVELPSRRRIFLRNLKDLIWPETQPPLRLSSRPGVYWSDVFVPSRLPWSGFLQACVFHGMALFAIWASVTILASRPRIADHGFIRHDEVVYYEPPAYLPPLYTGRAPSHQAKLGQPKYSKQPIISVPPESDNTRQTIVTPPNVRLNREVPLPNIVAWSQTQVAVPLAATERSAAQLSLPSLPSTVIAPAPVVNASLRQTLAAPEAKVIAPPPTLHASSSRLVSDVNIAPSQVVAPAPALPMAEQGTRGRNLPGLSHSASVVPPPPAMQGAGSSHRGGELIALGLAPAPVNATAPGGNRRGTFASTPDGKPGAAGTPESQRGDSRATASGSRGNSRSGDLPRGLSIGAAPSGSPSNLTAKMIAPRLRNTPGRSGAENSSATELEKQVFGDRKFYSLTLNMPNLNSAGGSWIIRFAELKENPKENQKEKDNPSQDDLSAPVARQKVDPGYPIELMRKGVEGTVTLQAVIRSDGSVGSVKVLRGVDDRLDEYARTALAQWQFYPATRNGNAIDLQALVMIPFKPSRLRSGF